jgi:hypothetical protein
LRYALGTEIMVLKLYPWEVLIRVPYKTSFPGFSDCTR